MNLVWLTLVSISIGKRRLLIQIHRWSLTYSVTKVIIVQYKLPVGSGSVEEIQIGLSRKAYPETSSHVEITLICLEIALNTILVNE